MNGVYGVATAAGLVGLLVWIIWSAWSAATTAGRGPDARFGRLGRAVVAAACGFGLGGISASFAGWPAVLAFGAALAGAALLVITARFLGPDDA